MAHTTNVDKWANGGAHTRATMVVLGLPRMNRNEAARIFATLTRVVCSDVLDVPDVSEDQSA